MMTFMTQIGLMSPFSFALVSESLAAVLPKRNNTITVPDGVTYSNNVICTPTSWTDIVSFFLGNYVAHAATIINFPGEPAVITTVNMILAILFPCMGASRGVLAIIRRGALHKDPLKRALQSRALCMVVRSREWNPIPSQSVRSLSIMPMSSNVNELDPFPYAKIARNKDNFEEDIKKLEAYTGLFEFNVCIPPWLVQEGTPFHVVPPRYTISGTCDLPPGYELAYVPSTAVVEPLSVAERLRFNGQDPQNLSSIYSFGPPLIALIQIVYASVTIYQSRGNQVDTYGYAAFGFTVIPYLIMSTVNLLGNMVTHSYPSIYLVHTELMDEASHRGGIFAGAVATLKSEPLLVNNKFVFSGLCQRRQGYLWEFEVGKLYRPGEIEPDGPMEGRPRNFSYPIRASDNGISDAVSPSSNESLSSNGEEAKSRLIIVCPTCYNFKVSFTRSLPPMISPAAMFISSLPLIAIGVLSHFKAGSSTVAQRIWILGSIVLRMVNVTNPMFADWIIHTTIDNPALAKLRGLNLADPREEKYFYLDFGLFFLLILLLCVITTPAIGHFVVVGQMLYEYGSCSQLQKLGV